MRSSHVRLKRDPIYWTPPPPTVEAPVRIFFDDLHHRIVRIIGDDLFLSASSGNAWARFSASIPSADQIGALKFSSDIKFLAALVGTSEVRAIDCASGRVLSVREPHVKGSHVLGLFWLPNEPAFVTVTNNGAELYSLKKESRRDPFRHIKTVQTSFIRQFWSLPLDDRCVLLLMDQKGVFHVFQVTSKTIGRLCKFTPNVSSGTSVDDLRASLHHIHGKVMIAFVDTRRGELFLMSVGKDSVKPTHAYQLRAAGQYDISQVDNVLVVHSPEMRVALLFDVRSDSNGTLSAPLPIAPPPPPSAWERQEQEQTVPFASQDAAMNGIRDGARPASSSIRRVGASSSQAGDASATSHPSYPGGVVPHSYQHWRFLAPRFILDGAGEHPRQGFLWELELDLDQIVRSWPGNSKQKLVEFLLQRSTEYSRRVVLRVFRSLILADAPLPILSPLFGLLNRVCYEATLEATSAGGRAGGESALSGSASTGGSPTASPSSSNPPSPRLGAPGPSPSVSVLDVSVPPSPPALSSVRSPSLLPSFSSSSLPPDASLRTVSSASLLPPRKRSSRGYHIIGQEEMCRAVFRLALRRLRKAQREQNAHDKGKESDDDTEGDLGSDSDGCADAGVGGDEAKGVQLQDVGLRGTARLLPVIKQYCLSVVKHYLPIDDCVSELLIQLCFENGRHAELHQHLQYHIIGDSTDLAQRLLQLADQYEPAYQLAVDMLFRLKAYPELLRILLAQGKVTAALRLLNHRSSAFNEDGLRPADFLSAALAQGPQVFYAAFQFFAARNRSLRQSSAFRPEDGCDEFVRRFNELTIMQASGTP